MQNHDINIYCIMTPSNGFQTWEDLFFTSDGKRKHVKRRLIVTKINPADTTKPVEQDSLEEHLQYEEVSIDQNANKCDDFDPEVDMVIWFVTLILKYADICRYCENTKF